MMATIRLTNTTVTDIYMADALQGVPGMSYLDVSDPAGIRNLAQSADLRTNVESGAITMSDGAGNALAVVDLYSYWSRGGFDTDESAPPSIAYLKSPDGSTWEITVNDLGILITTKVV